MPGLLTPYGGASLAGGAPGSWRAGARYAIGPDLSLDLEGTRREGAESAADPEHGLFLRANLRW